MILLTDIVEKVEYPDTRFCVIQLADPDKTDQVFLYAECSAPDTRNSESTFTVQRGRTVPACFDSIRDGLNVIQDLMHYIACHEVDEKLKYAGTPVFDPHTGLDASQRP